MKHWIAAACMLVLGLCLAACHKTVQNCSIQLLATVQQMQNGAILLTADAGQTEQTGQNLQVLTNSGTQYLDCTGLPIQRTRLQPGSRVSIRGERDEETGQLHCKQVMLQTPSQIAGPELDAYHEPPELTYRTSDGTTGQLIPVRSCWSNSSSSTGTASSGTGLQITSSKVLQLTFACQPQRIKLRAWPENDPEQVIDLPLLDGKLQLQSGSWCYKLQAVWYGSSGNGGSASYEFTVQQPEANP